MFDQTPSLPLRAAVASLLGGLFGIALILATHSAQAQDHSTASSAQAAGAPSVMTVLDDRLKRLGEAALQALRSSEPVYGLHNTGARFARLNEAAADPDAGLRWHLSRQPSWRNEAETARNGSVLNLGVQVRF